MSDTDSGKGSPTLEYRPRSCYRHPKIVDNDKNTKLHYLASKGDNEAILEYLQKESKVVDPENYLGWTPLMMACRKGNMSTVKILLDYRANTIKVNKFGINVLHASVASGNLKLVELILDHLLTGGISRRNLEKNFSLVSLAILFQHQAILEVLVTKHFLIENATKLTAITPLMFAQAIDNSAAISLLLKNKADTKTKNYLGHTTVDIAVIRQQIKFINPDQTHIANAAEIEKQQQQQQIQQQLMQHQQQQQLNEKQNENLKNMLQGKSLRAQAMLQSSVSSNQVPFIVLTPTELFGNPMAYVERKSSNISPYDIPPPPPVTPITPLTVSFPRQVFFPPEFSPCQMNYNLPIDCYSNDLLNTRINSSAGMFLSPPVLNFLSPRM